MNAHLEDLPEMKTRITGPRTMASPRVPDFFLVGAAKAGTTSLFSYLTQHPAVFIPSIKEPNFFSDYPKREFRTLESYLRLYSGCPADVMAGDASPSYLPSRSAASRIHALQPDARIMIMLRNPTDRAYSLYWQRRKWFSEELSFEDALAAEEERIKGGCTFGHRYVSTNLYCEQIERFRVAFGDELVQIYLFDDLQDDASAVCRSMFRFLGVDEDYPIRTEKVYSRTGPYRNPFLGRVLGGQFPGWALLRRVVPERMKWLKHGLVNRSIDRPPEMNSQTRAMLVETFRKDVEQLQAILNRDLSSWLSIP